MVAELLYKCEDSTGEGAIWLPRPGIFYWTDIEGRVVRSYGPAHGRVREYPLPGMCSSIVPLAVDTPENIVEHALVLAVEDRLTVLDTRTGETAMLLRLTGIKPGNRTNNVKASPDGRLWVGEMNLTDNDGTGQLFRIGRDLTVEKVLTRQDVPNGMAWDRVGSTMYYNDTGRKRIYSMDYDLESGRFSNPRVAVQVGEGIGSPDGMAIDAGGRLWAAHFGGHGIYVWNPFTGKLTDKVDVPVPNPASCTFGGRHGDTLYITTARSGMDAGQLGEYPLSGSLFALKMKGVKGGTNHYPFVVDSGSLPAGSV